MHVFVCCVCFCVLFVNEGMLLPSATMHGDLNVWGKFVFALFCARQPLSLPSTIMCTLTHAFAPHALTGAGVQLKRGALRCLDAD